MDPQTVSPQLRTSLHDAFHPASRSAHELLDALLLSQGSVGSARIVASRLGLSSRFALARWLARQGLPPLHELAGWVRMLAWLDIAARTDTSLCALALHQARDPAPFYRLVQRLTGRGWTDVRTFGVPWLLRCFLERCRGTNGQLPVSAESATMLTARYPN